MFDNSAHIDSYRDGSQNCACVDFQLRLNIACCVNNYGSYHGGTMASRKVGTLQKPNMRTSKLFARVRGTSVTRSTQYSLFKRS